MKIDQYLLAQTRAAGRALLARPASRAPGVRMRDLTYDGAAGPMRARLYEAPGESRPHDPLLVYFHGGGFIVGDIDTHDGVCSWLAAASRLRILSCSYRLAPEHAFPAQLDDARAACSWALAGAGASDGRISVGGDSAGAYLAARCALELNTTRPGAAALQILLYPLVHLRPDLWSAEIRNFRPIGRAAVAMIIASLQASEFPSLLDQDLSRAPPTILAAGTVFDPVRQDVDSLARALSASGVRVTERAYPVLMHGGFNLTSVSKTAQRALTEIGQLARTEFDAINAAEG